MTVNTNRSRRDRRDPVFLGSEPRELRELQEQTQVGMVFLAALMRRQLALSLTVSAVLGLLLAGQPLVARLWPGYAEVQLLGVPLPWLVLAVASYPALVLLGHYYLKRAEAIDEEFSDLLRS